MNLQEFAATGDVVPQGTPAFLAQVVLTAAADAATVVVRTGGAAGTRKLTLSAGVGQTVVWQTPGSIVGIGLPDGIHITTTGTGELVYVGWS